ncbi:MAG: hypothetical protein Q9214_000434 [Letrouitia sp. 1 TL-2023]
MSAQKAILTLENGGAVVDSNAPIPKLRDTHVIVNTKAVALNPTDWMHIDWMPDKGALAGCDYAGVVEEVGGAVTKFKVGDRVAGASHGGNKLNHEDGAFAEHVCGKASVAFKIPEQLSFEEASTMPVGVITAAQALYQTLGLPYPTEPTKERLHVLIYGGSSATGTLAIQLAKLSGLEVTTLASSHNHELLKNLGADHIFDYRSPTCASDIKAATGENIHHAFDCIASGESPKICVESMGPGSGKYCSLLPVEELPRKDITNASIAMYTSFGERFFFGPTEFPPSKTDEDFATGFFELVEKLVAEGKIKAHPSLVREGGLEGVLEGLNDLREKKVSGAKVVYKL